jgi:hypothetical protein
VAIDGELNKEVFVAYDAARCQSILSVAHVTGHLASAVGATLKTLGMGFASRKGKMRQHSVLKPAVKRPACTACGECIKYCPANAIALDRGKAKIDPDTCIGCAECVAVCRFGAVGFDWNQESPDLQKNIAEHALGVLQGKEGRAVFFNFAISITKDCDCFDTPNMPGIVDDIGILASDDPVAVDKACVDLIEQQSGQALGPLIRNPKLDPRHQLEHAERIGLGLMTYDLITVQ